MNKSRRIAAFAASILVAGPLLGGCAALGLGGEERLANPPALHDDESSNERAKLAATDQIKDYYDAMEAARKTPLDAAAVSAYVDQGIGLVDTYCRRWFARLELFERDSDKASKDTNVLTQMITALIGIAKLHPDVTAVYGAGTTALTGLRSNRTDGLVIASSSKGVKAKVFATLDQNAQRIREKPGMTFVAARDELERYADLCTWRSAKELVDKAVASTELSVNRNGEVTAVATSTFAPDPTSAALRGLWKPDGKTIDPKADRAIKNFMSTRRIDASVTSFLYDSGFGNERQRLLETINFN